MPFATFSNAGGSITSAVILTLLTWGVRWIRSEFMKRKRELQEIEEDNVLGPYHAVISATALHVLQETQAHPYVLLDVRPYSEMEQVPNNVQGAIRLPYTMIGGVLGSGAQWDAMFPDVPCPDTLKILVFIGSNIEQEIKAASVANSIGYVRSLCVEGSMAALRSSPHPQTTLCFISRDALALLLSNAAIPDMVLPQRFVLIDVRRNDERILFGAIAGSKHIPVDMIASSLRLPPDDFMDRHNFSKPQHDDLIVMCCRTNSRASWAAQIAIELGYRNCIVYGQGVSGWKLDPAVSSYQGYELGQEPPEPEEFEREHIDYAHGVAELQGILDVLSGIDPLN